MSGKTINLKADNNTNETWNSQQNSKKKTEKWKV